MFEDLARQMFEAAVVERVRITRDPTSVLTPTPRWTTLSIDEQDVWIAAARRANDLVRKAMRDELRSACAHMVLTSEDGLAVCRAIEGLG